MLLAFSVTLLARPQRGCSCFSHDWSYLPVARSSWVVCFALYCLPKWKLSEPRYSHSSSRNRYSHSRLTDRISNRYSHCCRRTTTSPNLPFILPFGIIYDVNNSIYLILFFNLTILLQSPQLVLRRKPSEPRNSQTSPRNRDTQPRPTDRSANRYPHRRRRTTTYHLYLPSDHRNSQ